jgi:hypothetical protein
LYNGSGLVNWIPGVGSTGSSSSLEMDSFTFTSSPSTVYGLPANSKFFTEVTVSPTGLTYGGGGGTAGGITQQTGSILRSDGTLLYTNSGEVWNPSTQQLLGTFLESSGTQLFYTASVLPDTTNGHTYFLDGGAQYSQYQALSIDVFDQATYALQGTIPFINLNSPDGTDLVRWGTNGFAFRCVDITGSEPSANQIVIVTSNLVSSNIGAPIPILSSVSPSPLYVGGAAFAMKVSGSGFTSNSTVLVDGNPRTTTYVNGNSLTAQVLASDIAFTGQLNVQVTTPGPGGGTSDYVIVAIENPPVTTPTVSVTLSATSITTAQGLTVTITVSGATGKPTPTGSVTLSGGGYNSSASALSSGSATFGISAGALTAGSDILTAYYSPDISSATTYNNASGSASVTVTVPKSVSTVTVNPASSTITNAEADLVSITVAGVTALPTPTGTVTLASGTYSAQQTVSSGAASFTIPAGALSSGANTLTANYAGDSSYSGSTSTTTVTVSRVVLTSPAPAGVSPGSSGTSTVALTAGNNYSGTMNVVCSLTGSPSGAASLPTCSISPASVGITAGGAGTTTFTVNTTAASSAQLNPENQNQWRLGGGTVLAGLLMLWIPRQRRRWPTMLLMLVGIFVAGAVACGGSSGGNNGNPTPGTSATTAGNYVFTVTGTDSANATITASTTVTVKVE